MALQTIIFDLDGTFINSLEDLADAGNQTLAEAGFTPLPVDRYRYLLGSVARAMMTRATEAAGQPLAADDPRIDRLLAAFQKRYADGWAIKSRLYPGVGAMIQALSGRFQLAVLSNKPDPFTQLIVAHFFPDQPFDAVSGLHRDEQAKPNPELALALCQQLGSRPDQTVFVGDSSNDMAVAVRAGMLPYGVLWGFRSKEELLAHGAVRLFEQADSLTSHLLHEGRQAGGTP